MASGGPGYPVENEKARIGLFLCARLFFFVYFLLYVPGFYPDKYPGY